MKLRLFGNSMRVRLSRSEVDHLANGETIISITHFSSNQLFEYRVQLADVSELHAQYVQRANETLVTISVPRDQGTAWARNTDEGIYAEQPNGTAKPLSIAVEKDFECLHSDDPAENHDAFPNPRER